MPSGDEPPFSFSICADGQRRQMEERGGARPSTLRRGTRRAAGRSVRRRLRRRGLRPRVHIPRTLSRSQAPRAVSGGKPPHAAALLKRFQASTTSTPRACVWLGGMRHRTLRVRSFARSFSKHLLSTSIGRGLVSVLVFAPCVFVDLERRGHRRRTCHCSCRRAMDLSIIRLCQIRVRVTAVE